MITDRKTLNKVLQYEYGIYSQWMFPNYKAILRARLTHNPFWRICTWQMTSRKLDYYNYKKSASSGFVKIYYAFLSLIYLRRKNKLSERLGLELSTARIGKGLRIDHFNNVINGNVTIGEDCNILGNVCIGNGGKYKRDCIPTIGNNVLIGRGVTIVGKLTVGDNVIIGANSLITKDVPSNATVVGNPAYIIKLDGTKTNIKL